MKKAIVCGIAAIALASTAQAQVINELMISHAGTDNQEFVEICAQPNEDLSGLTFVVIEGDTTSNYGTIDVAVTLGTAGPDGYYVAGNTAVANLDQDIGASNVLENGTNTFLLVSGFTGAQGDDIDADGDGVADGSIGTIVDIIGRNDGGPDFVYYGAPLMPADGSFAAAGVARCEDCTGSLDQLLCFGVNNCDLGTDGYANITPGAANQCGGSTATEEASWGDVKSMFR
ncbi:MAG: hypothetical protein HKN20_08835 [Gemmatimonadetes bacterium]|nr:hypothetical protein [Gemmatimonadota bacterium]